MDPMTDPAGAGILMLTCLGYIDGIHVTIYGSTMDPMGYNLSTTITMFNPSLIPSSCGTSLINPLYGMPQPPLLPSLLPSLSFVVFSARIAARDL